MYVFGHQCPATVVSIVGADGGSVASCTAAMSHTNTTEVNTGHRGESVVYFFAVEAGFRVGRLP